MVVGLQASWLRVGNSSIPDIGPELDFQALHKYFLRNDVRQFRYTMPDYQG
jgi:hypothetical protein